MDYATYRGCDAIDLADAHARGEVDAATLLDLARCRLAEVDPALNAVCIAMDEIADARVGEPLSGAFSGVPFLVKDLIQDYAGVPTTAGSRALRERCPAQHADYTQRALDAGMVIFGKTATPELGLKAVTESVLWGATRNPWDTGRTPGGSSGGAAAAVAAGVVPMAGANDGGGSIRIPASHCGLFGLRPSRGLVPTTPATVEHWEGASSDGVVSRSVRDSARMLDVLAGPGRGAPYHAARPLDAYERLAAQLPGRLRIGWSTRSPIGADVDPECVHAVERTAALLESLGHEVVEAEPPVDGMLVARAYFGLYFGQVAAAVDEAVAAGARERQFERDTRTLAAIGRAISAGEYVRMRQRWTGIAQAAATFFDGHDLWLSPTVAAPPPRIGELDQPPAVQALQSVLLRLPAGRLLKSGRVVEQLAMEALARTPFTQFANLTGLPAMSVPLHWTAQNLPIGSQFTAPWGSEATLLALATQLESAQPWFTRVPEAAA
ncbi:amidase [Algiphilus sp.]|uniref:amidase n=1 Tax=Algiphilus sp. TaxID=1872431 RepID=UPI0025BF0441|nr:amidase [Algiphilus sp.]MCK5768978.1 amidase [Algiphilus sp.]